MKCKNFNRQFVLPWLTILLLTMSISAQSTAFTYQGKLADSGTPATGTYDIQFKLFDALTDGNQIGATITNSTVAVSNGVFSAELDFGAGAFDATPRYLEICVRLAGDPNPYTVLAPRQSFTAIPYAMHSANAVAADGLSAACAGCVTDSHIETVDGAKVTGNVAGSQISGEIPTASVPTGSNNYIQNSALALRAGKRGLQDVASYNIDGDGIIGGILSVGTTTPRPGYQADINGRLLITPSANGEVQFGTPNAETGMSIISTNRADVRFDGTTLKLLAGLNSTAPCCGIAIDTFGNVGIGTFTPNGKLEVNPGGSGGMVRIHTPAGESGMSIIGTNRADIRYDGTTLKLLAGTGPGAMASTNGININALGNVGIGTTNPATKLQVVGTARTSVLEITGGSDLAEHFEVVEGAKPGMLVAIDPLHAGQLSIARGTYNRKVAGVISGANNLSAGMVLPDVQGSKKSMPIALSGRVWVYCDASRNAINPGDLLTTSATPGYAMKVNNYRKAQGAIIGKAMTELKSGRGLVLVLVSLQ